jgi:hypothetical protein
MNNAEDRHQAGSPEIDLLYFLRPVGNFFRGVANAIAGYFRLLAHNKLTFAIIWIAVTVAGYSLRYILPKGYETEGVFISHGLPIKFCDEIITNVNKYSGGKNKTSLLSQRLAISPKAAASISSIKMEPMIDSFFVGKRDSIMGVPMAMFRIRLVTKDTGFIDEIQAGLVGLLENNEYSTKRRQSRKAALISLKDQLAIKMQTLDSVSNLVNSSIMPRGSGQGIVLGEPISPVSVYQAQLDYFRERTRIDEELAIIKNIEVLSPFFKISYSNFPRFDILLMQFFLFGLAAALLITPFIGRRPVDRK